MLYVLLPFSDEIKMNDNNNNVNTAIVGVASDSRAMRHCKLILMRRLAGPSASATLAFS